MTYDRDGLQKCDGCEKWMPSPEYRRWGQCRDCRPKPSKTISCWFVDWCLFSDLGLPGCGVGCEKYIPDSEQEVARVAELMEQARLVKEGKG